jgi:hypothetical protein
MAGRRPGPESPPGCGPERVGEGELGHVLLGEEAAADRTLQPVVEQARCRLASARCICWLVGRQLAVDGLNGEIVERSERRSLVVQALVRYNRGERRRANRARE